MGAVLVLLAVVFLLSEFKEIHRVSLNDSRSYGSLSFQLK